MDPRVAAVATLIAVALPWATALVESNARAAELRTFVPQRSCSLAHGDKTVRALAGRALRSIIFGEVDVLEDLLGRRRPASLGDHGKRRADGRTLLDIAVEDAQMATPTRFHCSWPSRSSHGPWDVAEDERNLLVQRARSEVKRAARGRLQARPSGKAPPGLACLAARLDAPGENRHTKGFRAEDGICRSRLHLQHARALRRLRRRVLGAAAVRAVPQLVTYCCDAHRAPPPRPAARVLVPMMMMMIF